MKLIVLVLGLLASYCASTQAKAGEWSDDIVCYYVHDRYGMPSTFAMEHYAFPRDARTGLRNLEITLDLENGNRVVLAVVFRQADEQRAFPEMLLVASLRSAEPRVLGQEVFRSTDITAYTPEFVEAMLSSWETTVAASHRLHNTDALSLALAAGHPFNPDRAFREGHIDEGVTKAVLVGCTLGLAEDGTD
jgi:hypothetical protein